MLSPPLELKHDDLRPRDPNRPMHTNQSIRSRKRHHSEQFSLEASPGPAQKKQKVDHPSDSQPPPAFWDNLSQVWLTHNALRELDRRNSEASVRQQIRSVKPVAGNELQSVPRRFPRQGGPDLSDLRGYPDPRMNSRRSKYRVQKQSLSVSRGSSTSRASSTSRSTKRPSSSTKSSGPYDRDFQQHLVDHGIYPVAYEYPDGRMPPKPNNWNDIKERLARYRPSLSPSRFTDEAHEKFVRADAHAFKEKQITESVIPVIEGDNGDARCVAGGVPFNNLGPLTDVTLAPGNPDRYYGARPEQLDRRIRDELFAEVIPSKQDDLPMAPNFFLEAKGPDGSASVAKRQACYDGALGARGIHSLQTYGEDEPTYDNDAYTLTSIYHNGQLQMFTSHPSNSATSDRPEYYMTQLRSFALTDNVDTFREGATWYRNGRDWAKEQRDEAIRQANERSSNKQGVSSTLNASFDTVCEISSNDSVISTTERSYFSFNATDTPEESFRSDSPKRSQRKLDN
ncbi:hypothetical protein PISL3812_09918 [Talaromyces islandicus]|uniref:Uncharacterized protein n=1 Tax=Talaromyces islandicus TaxID=28573 RepID=A0A0U1MB58_TALIS|nr:hypothetical protein PISL3812_09918 [Talaromyces islandicus]